MIADGPAVAGSGCGLMFRPDAGHETRRVCSPWLKAGATSGRRRQATSWSVRIKSRSPLSAGGFQVLPEKTRKRVSSFGASGVGARRTISPSSAVTRSKSSMNKICPWP